MEKSTIKVNGMACEHCVKAITNALKSLPGVHSVSVDLKAKAVTAEYDPSLTALEKIKCGIEDLGYDVLG